MQETLEQWEKEKAEREQKHKKVLFEMRQRIATLQAQEEEEQTRFEKAKREVLLEEQNEKTALSEALLQTQGELSQACQQVQQLRQEVKKQQEKGQTIKAELQAELQEAQNEIQAVQRRHQEEIQGIKAEMNVLLEQREALQKQVGELTSQLAASRESQERIVQRAQHDVSEAQEKSRQKLLEVEHVQKMLEEAEHQNKKLQVHLQNMERERSHWEEAAEQNSELQASVNALESEKASARRRSSRVPDTLHSHGHYWLCKECKKKSKARGLLQLIKSCQSSVPSDSSSKKKTKERLILSLEEKNLCLRTLEEKNLALNTEVSLLRSGLQETQQLFSKQRRELQEFNTQVSSALASSSPGTHNTTFALEATTSFPS
ncbi:centrosome-associated protein CEP250-like [Sylvia atricapilla]|uniref:centrosome-associated protein CEP250-like n=1 Tax=Sylvia atricapilla TaxID=48155 RepID=UPI00339A8054